MDVAGPLPDRLKQNRVHEADDRGLIGGIKQVLRFVEFVRQLIEALVGGDIFHHCFRTGRIGDGIVGLIETGEQGDAGGQDRLDRFPQQQSKVIQCDGFQRIGRGDQDGTFFIAKRQHTVTPAKGDRDFLDQLVIHLGGIEMRDPGHLKLVSERFQQLFFP